MDQPCLSDAFLRQSPDCNWIFDADGVFRQIFGDPAPFFGKSAAELVGQTPSDVLDPDAARAWHDHYVRALAGEALVLRERHGKSVWHFILFPIRLNGEIPYAGAAARRIGASDNAEQELRHTVVGALRAQEFTRSTISRFLHDSLGQNLTALGLQLDLIRMDVATQAPAMYGRIGEIQTLLETIMEAVREYSHELNPSTVERLGLRPALDRLAARIRERFVGSIRLNMEASLKIDPKIAPALFQIAQEAAENAVQHSYCSLIEIAVKSTRAGPFLEICDNGRGFDPGDLPGGCRGLGLLSMEHYATEAGLDLSIWSSRGAGTIVRAAAPGEV